MFNNILGNQEIKELLINAVKSGKESHSYLFVGQEGIGKKIIAKEFAKMILCTDKENKYCNKCKSCIEFNGGNNPDFQIIEPDGNSLKIEQIREFENSVAEKPIISNKKVYIINDSDKMTQEAQNSLLKTLEEPPEYVTIILIGSNESAYLDTIKSRCMVLHFKKIAEDDIKEYLKNNYKTDIENPVMLEAFQGSIGKAIELLDKQEEYEQIENVILNLQKEDKIDLLNNAEPIYKAKDDKFEMLDFINIILLNLAKKNGKYANCIDIVEDTKKRLKSNANYDMSIDNMLLKLWEQVN